MVKTLVNSYSANTWSGVSMRILVCQRVAAGLLEAVVDDDGRAGSLGIRVLRRADADNGGGTGDLGRGRVFAASREHRRQRRGHDQRRCIGLLQGVQY